LLGIYRYLFGFEYVILITILSSTQERLPIFKLLLQAAKWATAGNELSEALVESVARDPHDLQIPQLLFDHGARIDHRTGEVLDVSTKIGNLPLLQLCVRMRPNSSSMERAFLSARRAKVTRSRRTELFASLLVRPPSNDQISAALEEAITRKNRDVDLLKLLLDHKASLNFNHAEGLCLLVQRGDLVTLDLLLRSQHANPTSLNRAFDLCIHLEKETRSEVATRLIPLGINAACLTGHLKKVVSGCHPGLLREMLVGGADPDRDGGECLKTAAGNGDLASLSLLMPFGIRQEYFNSAFENMLVLRTVEQGSEGLHCAELLLDHGIHQALKDRAILEAFEYSGTIRKAFVSILLKHGADSSTADCSCFVKAGSSNDLTLFDLLFQYERPPQLMISRLINESGNEQKVVDLIRRAFSHIESPIDVLNAEIMFMALRKFPRGSGELVKLLLDYGCPAGTTQTLKPKLKYEAEPLTPLVWCLHQPRPGISDAIVLKLLEKGEEGDSKSDVAC
jgi:hypothetical protein